MATATVRIPEDKRDILRIIAGIEKVEMKEILSGLIDEYVARHRESLELLSRPEWVEIISRGKDEVKTGVKGKSLDELAERLARQVAAHTGENLSTAVVVALEERLERLGDPRRGPEIERALLEISRRCSALPDLDSRSPDEILGYHHDGSFGG